jgi:hypothetical protein
MRNMKCACIEGSKGIVMSSKMSGSKNVFNVGFQFVTVVLLKIQDF